MATETKLADEQKNRLELEAAIAPRNLFSPPADKPLGDQTLLSNFGDQFGQHPERQISFILQTLIDAEPRRASGQIKIALDTARWKFVPAPESRADPNLEVSDGVELWYQMHAGPPTDRAWPAAEALREYLVDNHWEHVSMHGDWPIGPNSHSMLPANTVLIKVGVKPSAYFNPEPWKKLDQWLEHNAEIEKSQRESIRKRFPKDFEEKKP